MVIKERYFHKFVDDIMKDGVERSTSSIIEELKESMSAKDIHGRNRSGFNVPLTRKLCYYLRINDQYVHIDKHTKLARWRKVS